MVKEGRFGVQEGIALVTIIIVSKVSFTSPSMLQSLVGTASWYTTLISTATAMVGFTFVYLLLKKFPGKNIVEIYHIALGPYFGLIFSLLLSVWLLMNAAIMLREFTEVMKVYVLPLSPPSYIITIFLTGLAVQCALGLETIVRFARLMAYILLGGLIVILLLSWQNYSFHRLLPILGYGIDKTLFHGIVRSSVYGEVIVIAVFASSFQGVKYIKKVGYTSLVLSGLLVSACLMAFSLAFPYFVAQEITSSMYQLTTLIDYGRFLQSIDPVFIFMWNISTFIAITAETYASISIYNMTFGIQDVKPVLFPFIIIIFTVAMIPKDISEIAMGYIETSREYGWTVFYLPSILVFLIIKLRKGKGASANA